MTAGFSPDLPEGVRLQASAALAGELAGDLDRLVAFLAEGLAAALPGAVTVQHQGLLGRRKVQGVTVVVGEAHYGLSLERGAVRATMARVVSGVVLARAPVPLAVWIHRLLADLEAQAESSAAVRTALEGLL